MAGHWGAHGRTKCNVLRFSQTLLLQTNEPFRETMAQRPRANYQDSSFILCTLKENNIDV